MRHGFRGLVLMLSQQDNTILTQVGPGTPMGAYLRRFWMPALLEEEVPHPDCPPVRLKLLGEELVAFRDSNGTVGVLDAHCPHRQAELFFGRNEECGLRCVYHGWKFDVEGHCVDMPSEPPGSDFKRKIKQKSYRTAIQGGVVWLYMGPSDRQPDLPRFEWSWLSADRRGATKRLQECNWAQAYEGGIDSSHISLLHSNLDDAGMGNFNRPRDKYNALDRHLVFQVADARHGLLIGARRNAEADSYYWRVTQSLMPFYTMIPPVMEGTDTAQAPYGGHAWVPIDDHNTWTWSFGVQPNRPFSIEERENINGRTGRWGPIDENYRPLQNRANDYLIDREVQRTRSYTGIDGVPNQDAGIQESMGLICDRTKEHLGASDLAVIEWRKKILQAVNDLAAGKEPAEPHNGDWYNVRPASLVLPRDVDWQEGAAWLLSGLAADQATV
ncbi:MAG: Rieske 2Fe-2S domain-containing protein [Proteobacteria bacterium]|nr:Rieske 2Fe-2S domain-containing protein [Pseudomonadota bacterium]